MSVLKKKVLRLKSPVGYWLYQSHPNPFNSETVISYQLPRKSWVTIKVFNLRGQEIKTLADEEKEPGYFTIHWDGRDSTGGHVVSGTYVYRMKAEGFVQTRKMLLLR